MKFVSFLKNNEERAGIYFNGKTYDLSASANKINIKLPSKMEDILSDWDKNFELSQKVEDAVKTGSITEHEDNIKPLAPVPHPASCRDGYAFRQHVFTARRNRGVPMIPEFDQFPIFYFTNHNSIIGEGELIVEDDHLLKLDFELEAAVIIGKKGRNISSKDADSYIAGYTIMNDFSARFLQMEEMKLNLGPAKGKDFATAIGPWMVTPDELEIFKIETKFGNKYNLEMKAFHNGEQVSLGNVSDMNWTFAEIIERASYGVDLLPTDVIGSGTVGTGCYLELNGSWALQAKERGEDFTPIWLKENDIISLEINNLGTLTHKIIHNKNSYSLISKNKTIE